MRIRTFYPNNQDKIEFTKEELEKLLTEVYEEGRADGYAQGYAASKPVNITYPYTPFWYSTTRTAKLPYDDNSITCNDNGITIAENSFTIGDNK